VSNNCQTTTVCSCKSRDPEDVTGVLLIVIRFRHAVPIFRSETTTSRDAHARNQQCGQDSHRETPAIRCGWTVGSMRRSPAHSVLLLCNADIRVQKKNKTIFILISNYILSTYLCNYTTSPYFFHQ
jgi:hypothetical protein